MNSLLYMPETPPAPRRYMPQMDGLRAIAVASVLYQHWMLPRIPWGSWGVELFFVISGYLITGSLLKYRDQGTRLFEAARDFFWHRALRLFPAYYLLLAISVFLLPEVREHIAWYLLYASNLLMIHIDHFIALTPTWSLAVEEQFYILWFFVVLAFAPRMILGVVSACIIGASLFRIATAVTGHPLEVYLLPANLDSLALGVGMCFLERKAVSIPLYAQAIITAAFFALVVLVKVRLAYNASNAFGPLIVAAMAAITVWHSRTGFPEPIGQLLGNKAIAYVGRISYGIYLYHMIAPDLARKVFPGATLSTAGWPYFFENVVITLGLASLSYHLLERPILSARRRFSVKYRAPASMSAELFN